MTTPYVSGTGQPQLAPAEYWRLEVEAITKDARNILLRVQEAKRIARANKIAELVAATPAGAAVPGTTIGQEQALAWLAMVDAVAGFLATELHPDFTIEDGLYAMWPVIAEHDAPATG